MLKVEKITEKVELLDLEVQANPCKIYWDQGKGPGSYDCMVDCVTSGGAPSPFSSVNY